jgi:anti-sigma B factor antagonist
MRKIGMSTRDGADGGRTIELKGELSLEASPDVLECLRVEIDGAKALRIDLRDVTYIDSSGIAVLVQGYRLALKKGTEFFLVAPSPQVRSVIELSQLQEFFKFEE